MARYETRKKQSFLMFFGSLFIICLIAFFLSNTFTYFKNPLYVIKNTLAELKTGNDSSKKINAMDESLSNSLSIPIQMKNENIIIDNVSYSYMSMEHFNVYFDYINRNMSMVKNVESTELSTVVDESNHIAKTLNEAKFDYENLRFLQTLKTKVEGENKEIMNEYYIDSNEIYNYSLDSVLGEKVERKAIEGSLSKDNLLNSNMMKISAKSPYHEIKSLHNKGLLGYIAAENDEFIILFRQSKSHYFDVNEHSYIIFWFDKDKLFPTKIIEYNNKKEGIKHTLRSEKTIFTNWDEVNDIRKP